MGLAPWWNWWSLGPALCDLQTETARL
jgi:hypothetical protein